jgi:glutathione S-transferase
MPRLEDPRVSEDYQLFTFSLSHFSEKIRWMLDSSGITYRETPWTPFLHIVPALLKGRRRTTVPILQAGDIRIQDSTRIMLWLQQHDPRFKLIPEDPGQRLEVLELVERFDRMGSHVIRYVYSVALDHAETIKTLWTLDANRTQRAVIHAAFPGLRSFLRHVLDITPDAVRRSGRNIDEAIHWLEERVASQRFLVGERLSAADITAAALLAPLACPAEHPVYSRADYRDAIRLLRGPWQQRRGVQWVSSLYHDWRRHRSDR